MPFSANILLIALYCLILLSSYGYISPKGSRLLLQNRISIAFPSQTILHLSTTDFKTGLTFEIDKQPVKLLEFMHVKPGKGAAFVRTKVQNILTGSVLEKTFRPGEKFNSAEIQKSEVQYTYQDENNFYFMDMTNFDEIPVPVHLINNPLLYKNGVTCTIVQWNDRILEVLLPLQMEFTITETGAKAAGAPGTLKPAVLDTGLTVQVPMFIETDEKIIITTTDCKYVSRA